MKKVRKLLSTLLVLVMALSWMPGIVMSVRADEELLPEALATNCIESVSTSSNGTWWRVRNSFAPPVVVFEVSPTNSNKALIKATLANREYDIWGNEEIVYYTGYFNYGVAPIDVDSFARLFDLTNSKSVTVESGNFETIILNSRSRSEGTSVLDINGGKVGTAYGLRPWDANTPVSSIDLEMSVSDAEVGTLRGVGYYNARVAELTGNITIDVSNSTVGSIYVTEYSLGAVHNGNTYLRVLDSTVGNIYVDPNSTGTHSGYINSGTLNNTGYFTNLLYLDGTTWLAKGDLDAATGGLDFTVEEGQTMTVGDGLPRVGESDIAGFCCIYQ